MKKCLACILSVLLLSCATQPPSPKQDVEEITAALLQAYQDKNLHAFSTYLAKGYPDKKEFEANLANVFLTYADMRVSNVSIQEIISDGMVLHANVLFDLSFVRQRDEIAVPQKAKMRQIWHLSFIRENGALRLISLTKSAL